MDRKNSTVIITNQAASGEYPSNRIQHDARSAMLSSSDCTVVLKENNNNNYKRSPTRVQQQLTL